MKKRLCSALLAVAMVFTMFAFAAAAEGETTFVKYDTSAAHAWSNYLNVVNVIPDKGFEYITKAEEPNPYKIFLTELLAIMKGPGGAGADAAYMDSYYMTQDGYTDRLLADYVQKEFGEFAYVLSGGRNKALDLWNEKSEIKVTYTDLGYTYTNADAQKTYTPASYNAALTALRSYIDTANDNYSFNVENGGGRYAEQKAKYEALEKALNELVVITMNKDHDTLKAELADFVKTGKLVIAKDDYENMPEGLQEPLAETLALQAKVDEAADLLKGFTASEPTVTDKQVEDFLIDLFGGWDMDEGKYLEGNKPYTPAQNAMYLREEGFKKVFYEGDRGWMTAERSDYTVQSWRAMMDIVDQVEAWRVENMITQTRSQIYNWLVQYWDAFDALEFYQDIRPEGSKEVNKWLHVLDDVLNLYRKQSWTWEELYATDDENPDEENPALTALKTAVDEMNALLVAEEEPTVETIQSYLDMTSADTYGNKIEGLLQDFRKSIFVGSNYNTAKNEIYLPMKNIFDNGGWVEQIPTGDPEADKDLVKSWTKYLDSYAEGDAIKNNYATRASEMRKCINNIIEASGILKPADGAVASIALKTNPTKMTYIVGEKLDLTGGIMTVTFPYAYGEESETTSVDVVMTSEYVTTSADEITKTGTNRIKINYGGQSFNLDVKGVGVNSIEITTPPTKIDYIVGEELDVTGGKVTVTYSDNTTAELDLTLDMCTFDSTAIGEVTVTVTIGDKTATFTINVENDIVYGDLDGDGNVTNIDAVMLLQHVAKMNLLDEALIPAANVDGVGEVTNADAVLVLQYVAKLITSFPVEEVPEVPAE